MGRKGSLCVLLALACLGLLSDYLNVVAARVLTTSRDAGQADPFAVLNPVAGKGTGLPSYSKPPPSNNQPLIGILSQPGDGDGGRSPRVNARGSDFRVSGAHADDGNVSYIAASYVKWVESAGARPVPILYDDPDWLLEKKFLSVNGLLIPGGGLDLKPGRFFDAVDKLLKMALAANDRGDYFPVQGTCMGMEVLTIYFSKDFHILQLASFNAEDHPTPIRFVKEEDKGRAYFKWMPPPLLERIQTRPITMENHADGTTVDHFLANENLRSFFDVLTTSVDRNGTEYVTTVEAKHYPIYGTQWHPEKNAFEWGLPHIPHSSDAILVCQATANFFVNEARRSSHRPASEAEMDEMLIYNHSPVFSGRNGRGFFEQSYIFREEDKKAPF